MTPAKLRSHTAKELAQMARQQGIAGWHAMRKEELIAALTSAQRRVQDKHRGESNKAKQTKPTPKQQRVRQKIAALHDQRRALGDLSNGVSRPGQTVQQDRLVVLVRDSYWLHFHWELTSQSVDRARTSLAQKWHGAAPVLRVHRLDDAGATLETKVVEIHGGVSNWYVHMSSPPATIRGEIGYATSRDDFYCLARSNEVRTPAPGSAEALDDNWADVARNADRIYAMSGGYTPGGASLELQELLEQRLRRRLGRPSETRFGNGASQRNGENPLDLALDAEMVVYGAADPNAHVTVQGEPVDVNPDGSFVVKLPLPDRRQVIPVVASSADGNEQRTVILGVERNTKTLDPRCYDTQSPS